MKGKNRSNIDSPHNIHKACDLNSLDAWFRQEAKATELPIRRLLLDVQRHLDKFVEWPRRAVLLWEGCDRSIKYHTYPLTIIDGARRAKLRLDARVNGPAIAAFHFAHGWRPPRYGSRNAWSVHHLYSGKFPYAGESSTLHAAHDGLHCTQSAGLVAIHPIADQMCDEYPFFSWLLRAMAFQKFGYDPDAVLSNRRHDPYGFVGKRCKVICPADSASIGPNAG